MSSSSPKPNSLRSAITAIHIFILSIAILILSLKYYIDHFDTTLEQYSDYIYLSIVFILVCEIVFVNSAAERFAAISEKLEQLSDAEPIEDCYRGALLTNLVEREVARAGRAGRALAVLMIDIAPEALSDSEDGQAALRKTVIREMTRLIRMSTRTSDVLGQFEPGELALLLPDTPTDHAPLVAAKLRKKLDEAAAVPDPGRLNMKLVTARQAEDGTGIVWHFDEILDTKSAESE